MSRVEHRRHAAAPIQTVWDVLADHRGMSRWTPVRRVDLEREGTPAPNGVGAVRVISALGPPLREEITAFDPPRRLGYMMLAGAPVKDYHAETLLSEAGSGTDISWTVDFKPRLPGVSLIINQVIARLTKSLAKEAERRVGQ